MYTASNHDCFERVELIRIHKFCLVLKKKKKDTAILLYILTVFTGERKEIVIHLPMGSFLNKYFWITSCVPDVMVHMSIQRMIVYHESTLTLMENKQLQQ